MSTNYRLVAFVHDGDCTDCSYTPLEVPANLDIGAIMKDYRRWWTSLKCPSDYVSLADYLIAHHQARRPKIEEYDW